VNQLQTGIFGSSHAAHSELGDDLLFASSELNTMGGGTNHQLGSTNIILHSKTPMGRRTAGIEPRVPMVTVNPHITATLEATIGKTDADVTSGSNSVHNGLGFMQAKDQTLNFEDNDQNIRLR